MKHTKTLQNIKAIKKDKGTTEGQGNEGNNKEKQDLLPDKESPPVDNESSIIKILWVSTVWFV